MDPARERYVNLATFRKDGREVRTPVWVASDPEDASRRRCFVYTNLNFGKVKRIRANGRARLAPCDFRGKLRGDWVDARARVVTEADGIERGFAAIFAKYGWQMQLARLGGRLSGRWADRAMLEIELV